MRREREREETVLRKKAGTHEYVSWRWGNIYTGRKRRRWDEGNRAEAKKENLLVWRNFGASRERDACGRDFLNSKMSSHLHISNRLHTYNTERWSEMATHAFSSADGNRRCSDIFMVNYWWQRCALLSFSFCPFPLFSEKWPMRARHTLRG